MAMTSEISSLGGSTLFSRPFDIPPSEERYDTPPLCQTQRSRRIFNVLHGLAGPLSFLGQAWVREIIHSCDPIPNISLFFPAAIFSTHYFCLTLFELRKNFSYEQINQQKTIQIIKASSFGVNFFTMVSSVILLSEFSQNCS